MSNIFHIYFFVVTVWDALPELTGKKAFLFSCGWLAPAPIFYKIERFWMFGTYFRIVIKLKHLAYFKRFEFRYRNILGFRKKATFCYKKSKKVVIGKKILGVFTKKNNIYQI